MFTLEILYAVLQGLPAEYLDFLEQPWWRLIIRIEQALKYGEDPISALNYGIGQLDDWGREELKKALREVRPVMDLAGLSYRQKEALIALRSMEAASLAQLSRVLVQDRSNVHKRLAVLVRKGYAMRFFRSGGIHYFAVPGPVDKSLKTSINEFLNRLLDESSVELQPGLQHLPQ
jgi:predicted transcriptional regulator